MAAFTIAYTLAAALATTRTSNAEFLIYLGVMVVLIGLVGLLHWSIRLSPGALWGLSLWGFLHMAGGLVPVPASWPIAGEIRVLYSWWLIPGWLKYDMVVHAYGFGITTWVCWQGLCAALRNRSAADVRPAAGLLILCVAAGMGFGALNEIVEFIATLTVPETNVGGYVNTGWDLVSNLVGAVAAAALIRAFARRPGATRAPSAGLLLGLLMLGAAARAGGEPGPGARPVVNREYLPVLLDLIEHATNSIEFLALEYHDDATVLRVEAALADAAARGVRVQALVEDRIDFNAAGVERLRALGVDARLDTPKKMLHSKLFVVDGRKVLLGSTNLTGNSMDNNNETNLLLEDPALAGAFGQYIAALWADSFAEPDVPSVESGRVKTIVNRQYFPEALSLFESATQSVRVIMYGIKYEPKYKDSKVNRLVESLSAAHQRGVDVAVIMDRSDYNETLNRVNDAARQYLAASGVAVFDDAEKITTHAKVIVADDRVIIGSVNWGFDALERRNETCVSVRDPALAAFFTAYFGQIEGRPPAEAAGAAPPEN